MIAALVSALELELCWLFQTVQLADCFCEVEEMPGRGEAMPCEAGLGGAASLRGRCGGRGRGPWHAFAPPKVQAELEEEKEESVVADADAVFIYGQEHKKFASWVLCAPWIYKRNRPLRL